MLILKFYFTTSNIILFSNWNKVLNTEKQLNKYVNFFTLNCYISLVHKNLDIDMIDNLDHL